MAAKTEERIINIQPIVRHKFSVRIVGDSPLITHQWSEKAKKQIRDTKSGAPKVKRREPCNPIEEGMRAAYWLTPMPEEFTEEAFAKAIAEGARFGVKAISFKLAGNSSAYRQGWVKNQMALRQAYSIEADENDLVEIHAQDVSIREDNVTVGMGSADLRYRPMFSEWYVDLVVSYSESGQVTLDDILSVLDAGGDVGVGEWRPEKDGAYGRFHIDRSSVTLLG
ncbi:MAG: hypothetical protein LUH03_09750 [Oscillospiraceae bacterium]|nr:hypothetical protein [Oscillospiraceae bacterium]